SKELGSDRQELVPSPVVPADSELPVRVAQHPVRRSDPGRLLDKETVRSDLDDVRGRRASRRGRPTLELDRDDPTAPKATQLIRSTYESVSVASERHRTAGVDRDQPNSRGVVPAPGERAERPCRESDP